MSKLPTAEQIQHDWDTNPRWEGIQRNYSAAEVVRLRDTVGVGDPHQRQQARARNPPDHRVRPVLVDTHGRVVDPLEDGAH